MILSFQGYWSLKTCNTVNQQYTLMKIIIGNNKNHTMDEKKPFEGIIMILILTAFFLFLVEAIKCQKIGHLELTNLSCSWSTIQFLQLYSQCIPYFLVEFSYHVVLLSSYRFACDYDYYFI